MVQYDYLHFLQAKEKNECQWFRLDFGSLWTGRRIFSNGVARFFSHCSVITSTNR